MTDLELALSVLDRIGMKRDSYEDISDYFFEVAYEEDGDWLESIPQSNHGRIPDKYKILVSTLVIKDYLEKFGLECTMYIFFKQGKPNDPFAVVISDENGLTVKFEYLY
jgi:hypothetical protein